jgi:hypothetical protein
MAIEVQRSVPGNNQGKLGEMRLVVHSSGMFLYVKGYSTWGSLRLSVKGVSATIDRDRRRELQEGVRQIIEHDGTSVGGTAEHGRGTIAGPMGPGHAPPRHPDEPR